MRRWHTDGEPLSAGEELLFGVLIVLSLIGVGLTVRSAYSWFAELFG